VEKPRRARTRWKRRRLRSEKVLGCRVYSPVLAGELGTKGRSRETSSKLAPPEHLA